jgi:Fe-S-cluster containining protein
MTTLEGYRIVEDLISRGKMDLLRRIHHVAHQARFQPRLTTNALAALCIEGKDPPEENHDSPLASCPFLSNKECLIYLHRPLGCRCFFSAQKCDEIASAVVDPFLVTVNTIFLQIIEHVDAGGVGGNMTDVLLFLESEKHRKQYEGNASLNDPQELSVNRNIPGLLLPPEHHSRIQPILQKIRSIRMPRGRMGDTADPKEGFTI